MSCVMWTAWLLLLPFCWTQFLCPDVAELGSSLLLTCDRSGSGSTFIYTPYGSQVGCRSECVSDDNRLDNTTVNTTHVTLKVNNVQEEDGGTWRCGPRDEQQTPCKISVFQVPSCNISSESDTDKLHIGEEIRLSVAIEDHFCSDLIDFQLQTGSVTEKVVEDFRVDVADSTDVFNSTFTISHSHIGSVELLFICNTARERIPCGGVKSLRLQSCNIRHLEYTEDRNISVGVDQEVSLEVQVEEYSCPGNLSYLLLAGDVGEELERRNDKGNFTGKNIYESTFKVTNPHFGPVSLQLMCNDVNRNVSCGGVQRLVQSAFVMTHDQEFQKDETVAIVAGSVATLAIIIAVSLIVWCILTKRCKCCRASAMGDESCPYADVADNVHARPKSIRPGAYEEVSDINGCFSNIAFEKNSTESDRYIQMMPNVAYMSVEDKGKDGQ